MIRFILLNAFIAIDTIVMSLFGLFISIFDRTGKLVHAYCASPWAKSILWVCGVKVKIRGLDHIKGVDRGIYMANHQSMFDIFTLLACLPVDFKFVLKKELMKIPFLGGAMRRAGYISIDRENPRNAVKSINEAAEKIKNGTSVLIFPEGTRSLDGRLQAFKKGGFHLAIKSRCNIVPVAIIDSHLVVPKGSLRIKKGTIKMSIGRPIPTTNYLKKEMNQLMELVRDALINEMKESQMS